MNHEFAAGRRTVERLSAITARVVSWLGRSAAKHTVGVPLETVAAPAIPEEAYRAFSAAGHPGSEVTLPQQQPLAEQTDLPAGAVLTQQGWKSESPRVRSAADFRPYQPGQADIGLLVNPDMPGADALGVRPIAHDAGSTEIHDGVLTFVGPQHR